jgi:fucose permease
VKPFLTPAVGLCAAGLVFFALTPTLLPNHIFAGFLIATIIMAAGGDFLEICLSPIVDAIPSDTADSSKALSLLHSFYAWGQVAVVLFTSLLLFFGVSWRVITLLWVVVPVADALLFAGAPIAERATGDVAPPIRKFAFTGIFVVAFVAIACGGASEQVVAQYASSFLEKGLGMSKLLGDILGLCGFAVFLGIGRMLYGLFGDKINMHAALIGGSALAFAAYITIVFAPGGWPSVAAIALCGLFVSLLWPGTLAVAAKGLPLAGASMFALLSGAGSLGCAIGPWVDGVVTDLIINRLPDWGAAANAAAGAGLNAEQFGLRAGLLAGAAFPLASFVAQYVLKRISIKRSLTI